MTTTVETVEYDDKGRVTKRIITTTTAPERSLPFVNPIPPFQPYRVWY